MSFFSGLKCTKIVSNFIYLKPSSKVVVVRRDAFKPYFVFSPSASIGGVVRGCGFTKVIPAVVVWVAVAVVDLFNRITAHDHFPDQAMGDIDMAVDTDNDVFPRFKAYDISGKVPVSWRSFSPQNARGWVVSEKFKQTSLRGKSNHLDGHRASSNGSRVKRIGGVPALPICASYQGVS